MNASRILRYFPRHRTVAAFSALAIVAGLLPAVAAAAPAPPPEPAGLPAQDGGAAIAPHRAAYKLSLGSVRNGSNVSDVRGAMTFEWADACEGWTTQQRFQMRFGYVEGGAEEVATSYATWESKDGRLYRFNVRKLVDGDPDQTVSGIARLNGTEGGGSVTYAEPEAKDEALAAGTVFPTAHTLKLLQKVRANERFYSQQVFDGADDSGTTLVSAVIAAPLAVSTTVSSPLLTGGQVWPVRMAFFPLASVTSQPDYEMTVNLLANGVAERLRIDYGDFTIDAKLESIEILAKPDC